MNPRFSGWLMLMGALVAVAPLSIDMYLPAFPAMADALGTSRGAVERTLPAFMLGLAASQLVYGPISDRYGRRLPLGIGLAIYALGSFACAMATSIEMLSAMRLLQALGGGAGLVIARAVIRDRLDIRDSARAMSTVMLVMGVAPILAPIAGGLILARAGWQAIFVVQGVLGMACLFWALATLPETRPAHAIRSLHPARVIKGYGELLVDRSFILAALCGGFCVSGMFAYIAGSPYVLIRLYGLTETQFSILFAINAAGFIVATQFNGWWLKRRAPEEITRRTVAIPLLAASALLATCLLTPAPLALVAACIFLFVTGLGFINPNTSALAMGGQGQRAGAASALLGSLSYAVGTLAGIAVSLTTPASALPLAVVMTVAGLLGLLLGVLAMQRRNLPRNDDEATIEPIA